MADNTKQLAFEIKITDNVSVEQSQLAKIELSLKNLEKAKRSLIKAYQDGKISEQEAVKQLTLLTREMDSQKTSLKELNKIADSAPDSLNRMRASLIQLKDQYANGSAALRTQLTPEISKLTGQISKAEQAVGVHSRGVGSYTKSIKEAVGQIFAIAAPAAAAAFALNGLKEAFAGTEKGANLLGRAKLQMTAFFDAIVEGRWKYAFGNELPKDIKVVADLMNKVRIEERDEIVKISEKELEIKDLRIEAIKAGKDSVKQVELLTLAEQKQGELIQIKLNHKAEELDYVNKIVAKDPENTAWLNKQAQLQADINNILGERSLRIASKLEAAQEKALAAAQKEVEYGKELTLTELGRINAQIEAERRLADARMKSATGGMPNAGLLNWNVSNEVAAVKYKDKVKKTLEDIGNVIDAANQKEMRMTEQTERAKLQIIEAHAESKMRIMSGATNLLSALAGKNKALQKAELVAEKGLAIAEIVIQTQVANAQIRAKAAASTLPGPGYLLRVLANEAMATPLTIANNVAAGLNIAGIIAATAAGLAGFASSGKVRTGVSVPANSSGDNTLILAKTGEVILNERHQAMLGGANTFKQIGVPGFASSGIIGQRTPSVPMGSGAMRTSAFFGYANSGLIGGQSPIAQSSGFSTNELRDMINAINARADATDAKTDATNKRFDRIEVYNDLHKLHKAEKELTVINQTNKI